ncbi:PREDICTED: uncharacterized protein LOC109219052 isoform X3 [Nicotiana attenuata]|uniref:uncharacterized protein LOC109219052 isoform X3 n=1 Tax=Nicotiana attenuata TaxID=49451 RepID=UPI000905C444|nr:PREDICTED: uncharacterized protein LOC109219052 isoform X3 [Nicotiana attenuata]
MDFDNMKRKELQALCKKHGIPANLTNLEMANKLSSIFKVNDEKPLTQGRSCLKVFDETVDDRESDVVDRTLKKVKFSPDDEIFEFTKLVEVKSRGRRKSMLHNNSLSVRSDGVKIGILDSPVRVTRSRGMNSEDGVSEKKGRTRRTKDNILLVNESEDEVGMNKRRSLRNKDVVSVQERREENEGVNEGLRTSRRVKGEINANKSAEELDKSTSEKEIDRAEKRDKKVTFASDDQIMECMKAETKAKEMKRGGRRKKIAHTQTSHVPNEVDAKVRDEVLEKPAERITRSRNLKSVEDDVSNKRNQTRGKEVIERNVKLLCTEFVESSVEAAKNEVKVTTRRSQQNNVVEEASQTALKRSKRQATKAEGARFTVQAANDEVKATTRRSQQNRVVEAAPQMALTRSKRLPNKVEGARLTDDISKDKMVTRDRTRNQSNLVVEASTSEVVPQLDEQVEVPLRRSDRRKSIFPLEKLRSDEAVAVKEKRNLNVNDDEMANKGKKGEPPRALKRSKRLATQVEDSVLAKDDIAENKVVDRGMTARNQSNLKRNVSSVETRCKTDRPTESQGTVEVGITLEEPGEAPVKRSNRRKSVVPSLEKLRTDEVAAAKEKRNLDANDDKVRGKSTKEEPQKALKRSKGLAQQVEDSVPAKNDIAENKVEERRRSGRNAAKANVDTKILDGSVPEEIAVVKEEGRRSERSAAKASVVTKIFDSSVQEEVAVVKEERRHSERSAAKDSVVTKISDSSVKEEIAAVKEERRRSERSAAKANVVTETLDSSAQEEILVMKEERRPSGRSAASLTLIAVSDEKKGSDCTAVPEKSSTKNKFALQDLDALKQSTSRTKINVEAPAVVEKTSTAGKKQQISNVEVEDPTSEDMEVVRESDSKDCDISGSEGATSFLKSGLNELEAVKNDVNIVLAGTKAEAVADSSTLAETLKKKGLLVDANASPSENNSTFKCPPFSDPFSSKARPDENAVEQLLQSDHEAPASKGLCPSSVLADDAIPNDITSDKQEHGAIAADDAEESDTELSNEVIDNSSLCHSDNMEENLESGLKEQSETGCIVDEGVTYGEQEPASNLADDAVPNDLTLDKKEHGAIAADNADEFDTGLSNEVLDNYSLNQSDNMEGNLESCFEKQSETGFIVTEGVTSGEQELTVTDYAREFDVGLSSNVSLDSVGAFNLSNEMEAKNSESGPPMEKAAAGFIAKCDGDVPTFTTQGELHAEGFANLEETTKDFSPISQPDNDAAGLSNAFSFEKSCDHGKQSTFRPTNSLDCSIQTSSELAKYNEGEYLDDQENEPDEGVRSIEFEAAEGQEEIIDDEQLRNSNDNEDGYLEDQENGPDEGVRSIEFEATEGQEEIIDDGQLRNNSDNEDGYLEDQYNEPDQGMQQLGHSNDSEGSVEAAASEKTVSSPIKAVLDFQVAEPAVFGDDIALEDSDEEKRGEELKVLFATPCDVSHSKEESKASLEGDSRLKENKVTLDKEVKNREIDENLNRRGQASSTTDNLSLQSSVRDCDEHGQGEILKSLFATPFGGRSSKVEIATSIELNETSSQYKHSCLANENTFPSAGNGLTQPVTPLKDTSKDEEAGEELKSLFATPLIVSRSIGGEPYHFQSQLSGEGLDSSGKRNPSEPVGGLIEDEQEMSIVTGEHLKNLSASPISVKSTNEETTSTKGKYSQSHEMETFSCGGLERNVGECEDGPAGVDQAPETSHIASFNYGDESEQDQLKMLFASTINTQPLNQMDGSSSKTEELSAQGLSHNTGLAVANPSAVDLSVSDSIDSKQSENNITVEKIKETPECIKGSSSLEEENNEGQGNMLSATSAKSMTPLRKDELSSQEPKTEDVAMSGEMVRDQGMNTRPESRVQEIVDIEEHGNDEIVADRDLLLRDTSKSLEEDVDVEIANQSTSAVISEPTFDDADFSEEQMLEINKSSPESSKPSDDVYNEENTEDHLKLLFATPIKGTSPSRLSEASTCQLKTTMITIASEMVGKEPKCKGFEFSGEPLTVEIIDGSCESRKGSCLLKENEEQFKRGALFATPSKSASPLQLEESFGCLWDTTELALSTKGIDSKARNKSQGCPLGTMEAKESCEPSKDSEALEHIESSLQEPEIEEAVAGKDLLLIDTSEYPEENIYVEIANKNTSAVISEPACDDLEFSEQQMVLETHKSSPESIKQSDAVNEENSEDQLKLLFATPKKGTNPSGPESIKLYDAINEENSDDHLKLLFATPIKGTSPSKLDEDSTCQLKTAMIATASEMVGKEPKCKGSEFSGEPLTVEIIAGGSSSTKGSCLFKENEEQFKGGPLFATPSKGTSPLQLEESPCCEEDIFKDMDGGKFLSSQEQSFAQYEGRQLLNEMIDDTGEATLNWFQTNDGSVLRETELETQKENDSVPQFEPLHEKGEVTEDDALAEGQAHDRQMTSQESPEDEAAKGGSVSDAVCQQPNMLLSDTETENITQESLRKTDGTSISAESGILDFDAESTTLRSQEKVIITLEETRGDEEQNLEVRNTSNAFQYNIPNNDEDAKEISIVWPADKQFHFPEHNVIENVASTREFTASTIESQYVFKEVDLAVQRDRLTVFESNESTSMNVKDSVLTTQMDLPGILCEEAQSESDQGKSCEANQQDEFSFDKKEHETTEPVVSPSYKSRANISFIEEGFAGEDTLMSEKKNSLAEKKEPFTPAGVAKTSLAEHLNSTVKKKNVRTILIHGTPNKQSQKADMKENDPNVKGNIGTLTALRPEKRRALQILPWK